MKQRRLRTLVGLAMVGLGLIQAGLYGSQGEWIPTVFGLFFSLIGVAYLWPRSTGKQGECLGA